jgi:hypothetical protein
MALLKDYYNTQFNVTIPNCYWKIEVDNGIQGGKTKLKAKICCYKDKVTADTNHDEYTGIDFEFAPDLDSVTNFIAQAYTYAKTLPEFVGAADV